MNMLKFLPGVFIGLGLGSVVLFLANNEWWWISIFGFIFFSVGLQMTISQEIESVKEEIKREILDEISEK